MINLTYDPKVGLAVRDGDIKDFVGSIISRHAKNIETDPKYSMAITTGSWFVVAGVLQYVAEAELDKDQVKVTSILPNGTKFGPKTSEDDGSVDAIINGDEGTFCPTDEFSWLEILETLTGLSV